MFNCFTHFCDETISMVMTLMCLSTSLSIILLLIYQPDMVGPHFDCDKCVATNNCGISNIKQICKIYNLHCPVLILDKTKQLSKCLSNSQYFSFQPCPVGADRFSYMKVFQEWIIPAHSFRLSPTNLN